MLKKIIDKTFLFIVIVLFVIVFKSIFGDNNSLVGVAVIIEVLVLMGENLIPKAGTNFIRLLIINVLLGVGAFIASQHILLGLVINFVVLTLIGYFCTYNLNRTLTVPFGLLYLFMLYTPVEGSELIKRYLALAFGAICIMAMQFLINRKKSKVNVKESKLLYYLEDKTVWKAYKIWGKDIHINTIRLKYGVRIGILVAITAFIVYYFNLREGRWLSYTVFSLTELYADNCRIRSKQRLEGTLIGVAIVIILFIFIKNVALRGLIVLIFGYANSFTDNYRDDMICVTASVVASMALTNSTIFAAIERIIYVVAGIVIALIANHFLFEVKSKESIT